MQTQKNDDVFIGTDKRDMQNAANEYFRWTLPSKIMERMCRKHPNIIQETKVLIHGLCHKWSSTKTLLSLMLFRETSKHWIEEVLKDELVGQMAPQAKVKDVIPMNEEYIFFMMLTNFLLPKPAKEQAASLVAYPYTNGNSY